MAPIELELPTGQILEVDTDDKATAINAAKQYLSKNPITEEATTEEQPATATVTTPTPAEEEEQGTFREIAEGVGAGLIGIPQGIAELGAAGIDLIADTNTSRAVTSAFTGLKESLGLEPTTTAGKTAEGITNFAGAFIPVVGWLGRAGQVSRAVKAGTELGRTAATTRLGTAAEKFGASKIGQQALGTRTRQAVTTTLAGGTSDFLVAPDGTKTLADAFDALPMLETEDSDTLLSGREEAGRRLRNKLRHFAEGTAIGGVFEAAFPVVGGTVRAAANVPFSPLPPVARAVSSGIDKAKEKLDGSSLQRIFSSRGASPREVFEDEIFTRGSIDAATDLASKQFAAFEKSLKSTVRGTLKSRKPKKQEVEKAYDELWKVLRGEDDAVVLSKPKAADLSPEDMIGIRVTDAPRLRDAFGKEAAQAAVNMRSSIDDLSESYFKELDNSTLPLQQKNQLKAEFADNITKYIHRSYDVFLRPEKRITADMLETPNGKAAIDEVSNILRGFNENQGKTAAELQGSAKREIFKIITKDFNLKNTDDQSIRQTFDEFKKAQKEGRKVKEQQGKRQVPLFQLSEGIFKDRVKLMEKSPKLRELLGEKKNSKDAYISTIGKVAENLAGTQFYNNLRNDKGLTKDIFDTGVFSVDQGKVFFAGAERPRIVRIPTAQEIQNKRMADGTPIDPNFAETGANIKDIDEFLKQQKYTKLGGISEKMSGTTPLERDLAKATYGDLSGSYVAPEFLSVLRNNVNTGGAVQNLLALALQAKGLSQISRTVLNPLAQVRNGLSGSFFLAANGNIGRDLDLSESFKLTLGKASNLTEQEFKEFFEDLGVLNLRDQNIIVNEFKSLIKEGAGVGATGKTSDVIQNFINEKPVFRELQKLYSGTDTFWKVAALIGEQAKYASAFKKSGLSFDTRVKEGVEQTADVVNARKVAQAVTDDFLRAGVAQVDPKRTTLTGREIDPLRSFAAEIVNRTMPTYNRVAEVIRNIKRIPVFGNFVAFPAEIIRNSSNILDQSVREMGYKAGTDLIDAIKASGKSTDEAEIMARNLEKEVRAIGAKRASGYLTSGAVVPAALQKAALQMNNMTEEDLDAMRPFIPVYHRGNIVLPLSNPKDGIVDYIDLSYMMPYDYLLGGYRAAVNSYSEKGFLTDNEVVKIGSGAWDAFTRYMEPFAGESLIAERLQNVLPFEYIGRGGRTPTGSKIYEDEESIGDKLFKSFTHIAGGLTPGFVDPFTRERSGELRAGPVIRSITDEPTKSGERTSLAEEFLTTITGLRRSQAGVSTSLPYLINEYKSSRSSALFPFSRVIGDRAASENDITQGYREANQNLFRVQSRMHSILNRARKLGLDESDIAQIFKENGIGSEETSSLLDGEFKPATISDARQDRLAREGEQRGRERITTQIPDAAFDIQDELFGRKLGPKRRTSSPMPPPSPPPVPIQTQPPPGPRTNVNPILVPNPVTRGTFGQQ